VLALGAIGCGRSDAPDLVNGKTQFVEKCGRCHVLARAPGASGTQGPNLDQAFGPARRQGLGEQTVQGVVEEQIALVRRNSTMPPNLVTGADRRDVAAYVGQVAGRPGEDTGALATAGLPDVSNVVAKAKGNRLEIDAVPSGATSFTAGKATAPAGSVVFVMKNPSDVPHNIALEGGTAGPVVGKGQESEFTENVKPGKYTYLCTVPGHAEGGMKGELTVE
jgi:uncharacterized cupredoxin-like copper-binding protein